MKRTIWVIACSLLLVGRMAGQRQTVQNRPYADLRQFHFGIQLGTHVQDLELTNVGMQTIVSDDREQAQRLITTDQNRWDPGFHVGVLGEYRLTENLQFRIAPTLFFGSRHIRFQDIGTAEKVVEEHRQNLKTVYIATAAELIFAGPRFNNTRPYVVGGVSPMLNLNGKSHDYIKLKPYDIFAELGLGVDLYLPYFKLRPELKFMFGLLDCLDKAHAGKLKDKSMLPYANSMKEARSRIVALCFYFE